MTYLTELAMVLVAFFTLDPVTGPAESTPMAEEEVENAARDEEKSRIDAMLAARSCCM